MEMAQQAEWNLNSDREIKEEEKLEKIEIKQ